MKIHWQLLLVSFAGSILFSMIGYLVVVFLFWEFPEISFVKIRLIFLLLLITTSWFYRIGLKNMKE